MTGEPDKKDKPKPRRAGYPYQKFHRPFNTYLM
jgi:hypothetical protein